MDWPAAARAWRVLAALHPDRAAMFVQSGHALKESGLIEEAILAYRKAASLDRGHVDARLHLAALLGWRLANAEAARCYVEILAIDPDHGGAVRGLAQLGQRRLLPPAVLDPHREADRRARVEQLETELRTARQLVDLAAFPVGSYDAFRALHPVPGPPAPPQPAQFSALVLALATSPALLGATLRGLADQGAAVERVYVVGDADLGDHPAASLGSRGWRPAVIDPDKVPDLGEMSMAVVLAAGTMLDAQACAWFATALHHRPDAVVYGDHDACFTDVDGRAFYAEPVLYPVHDPAFIGGTQQVPPAVAGSGGSIAAALRSIGGAERLGSLDPLETIRDLVLSSGHAVHVPRRLASGYRLPEPARSAPFPIPVESLAGGRGGVPQLLRSASDDEITVVIPSRDAASLLDDAVRSIRAAASRPDLLTIVVMDHRSRDPAAVSQLARLRRQGDVVDVFDEPFNWSRINNLGAARSRSPLLVFANNDVVMVSTGWDEVVRRSLADGSVGAVGAKLLYPNDTIQHAGILTGVGDTATIEHEGIACPASDPGPAGRWITTRSCSAVTGAFLACRRSTFEEVGGFNEALAVAYNDVDFCFRVRALGGRVVLDPGITLIHFESRTRGHNVGQAQVAWDESERAVFMARWGAALRDPAYNPQWARAGLPFDGWREPAEDEVLRWIERGARPRPWAP